MATELPIHSGLSHQWEDETLEAKARWFQHLSIQERMELLCAFTDFFLMIRPTITECEDAQPSAKRIRILTPP